MAYEVCPLVVGGYITSKVRSTLGLRKTQERCDFLRVFDGKGYILIGFVLRNPTDLRLLDASFCISIGYASIRLPQSLASVLEQLPDCTRSSGDGYPDRGGISIWAEGG